MNTLEKTVKILAIVLLATVGATFFYAAGLGTGLYVARVPQPTALPGQTPAISPSTGTPPPSTQTLVPPTDVPTPTATISPKLSESEVDRFEIFWEAWHILEEEFYGDLPQESDLPYAAIRGVIATTGDQYTAFIDPVQAEIMRTDLTGSFEGIGATVRLRPDGRFQIVQPLAGFPAIKAGLRAEDLILQVDGKPLDGMTIYEAITLIRGPAGTTVSLLIERQDVDEPFIIEIERARIDLPVIESDLLDNDIAYIRLTEFGQTATEKLETALGEAIAQDAKGLIFDLRGNPGGYLSVAVEVASQFVGEGPILIERFKDGREQPYNAISGGLALDIPMVVLVDGGSASASEIVAGAIQDTERAILIGTKTLGKGSVQLVHTLSDDSQLRVTVARWFTPNGRAIHGEGLEPDIEIEITDQDLETENDPQLERAILYLLEGK